MDPLLLPLLVLPLTAAIVFFGWHRAARAEPAFGRGDSPQRTARFTCDAPPGGVRDALDELVGLGGYELLEEAPDLGLRTLGSGPSAMSWGFFFPVRVQSCGFGGSVVEVGIRSRFLQWGPVVGRHHQAFLDALGDRVKLTPATATDGPAYRLLGRTPAALA